MNLDKFLTFVTHHNEAIIQWLFFGILALSGLLIARSLFSKKGEDSAAAGGDLHSALEKILAQTTKLENVSVGPAIAGADANPQVEAQVAALKADLAVKEKELTEIKAKGGADAVAASGELSVRIKELEAKLAEYEILEDDIADLSLYKEENSRLKSEIDKLKGGAGAEAPAAVTAAAAVVAAETMPTPKGDDIVAEFAQVVEQSPPLGDAEGLEIPDTGDTMKDFEQTVKLEKKLSGAEVPAPASEAAPAPAAAQPPAEADDLFAEFSQSSADGGEASAENLDTDKMMAEMAALVSVEPTADNALEENIDTEKMADEAKSFEKS